MPLIAKRPYTGEEHRQWIASWTLWQASPWNLWEWSSWSAITSSTSCPKATTTKHYVGTQGLTWGHVKLRLLSRPFTQVEALKSFTICIEENASLPYFPYFPPGLHPSMAYSRSNPRCPLCRSHCSDKTKQQYPAAQITAQVWDPFIQSIYINRNLSSIYLDFCFTFYQPQIFSICMFLSLTEGVNWDPDAFQLHPTVRSHL